VPGDPTSLRNCSIRAQAALVESAGSEQEAEKELQAVEDNVPGWMTQFPSSVLTDTLRVMDQQAKLAEALPEKKLVRADGAARPTPEVAVDPARGTHPAGSALQAATSGMAASGESVSPAEMERRVLERGTAVAVGKAKNQSSGGEKTENDPVLAQEAGRLAADLRRAAHLRALAAAASGPRAASPKAAADSNDAGKRSIPSKIQGDAVSGALPKPEIATLGGKEAKELGSLFGLNTVMHKLGSETKALQQAIVSGKVPQQLFPTPTAVVAERRAAARRRQSEKRLEAQAQAKEADLAESEGRAALEEAAKQLLAKLPASDKDPWLRTTLAKIARQAGTLKLPRDELARLSGAHSQEPCSVKLGRLPACATHRHPEMSVSSSTASSPEAARGQVSGAPEVGGSALASTAAGRRQAEAQRLLHHMLSMAHADFARKRAEARRRLQSRAGKRGRGGARGAGKGGATAGRGVQRAGAAGGRDGPRVAARAAVPQGHAGGASMQPLVLRGAHARHEAARALAARHAAREAAGHAAQVGEAAEAQRREHERGSTVDALARDMLKDIRDIF
jgi:hypothetical protein